jgi:hypothetical protein
VGTRRLPPVEVGTVTALAADDQSALVYLDVDVLRHVDADRG